MVSSLGTNYKDAYINLMNSVSPELRKRIEKGRVLRGDILEIIRVVNVREEGGVILISKNLESKVVNKESEAKQIELVRKICSLSEDMYTGTDERVKEDSGASKKRCKIPQGGSVRIVRSVVKRKDETKDCSTDESNQEKLTPSEICLKDIEGVFKEKSIIPDPILTIMADYIEEMPNVVANFSFEERIPDYLKSLTELDLSNERVDYKTFCSVVRECKNLRALKLPQNADDSWLKAISENLTNIKSIHAIECQDITDIGLGYISSMVFLEKVTISIYRYVTDDGIDLIVQKLENLQELDLERCTTISDKAFENIGKRKETLKLLNLKDTRVSDVAVTKISEEVTGLEKLNISSCNRVTDGGINSVFTNLSKLKELILSGCDNVTDEGLINFGKLSDTLELFDISFCEKIAGEFLTHIDQSFKVMTQLNLSSKIFDASNSVHLDDKFPAVVKISLNSITHDGLRSFLKTARNIESINLYTSKDVDDDSLKCIADECPKLISLSIAGCKKVTNSGLNSIVKSCLDLTGLDISSCHAIDDNGLKSVADHCHKLQSLRMSDFQEITDEGLKSISIGCPELRHIYLSDNAKVTDLGIMYLSQGIKALQYFYFIRCTEVTSDCFKHISKWSKSLLQIDMSSCEKIDDKAFSDLNSDFPLLCSLNLGHSQIGDNSLSKFAYLFPSLDKLSLGYCKNITNEGLSYLKPLLRLSYLKLPEGMTDIAFSHIIEIPRLNNIVFSFNVDNDEVVNEVITDNFKKNGLQVLFG